MSTTILDVPLSNETRERLKKIATRSRKSEAEIAATLIKGAIAADDLEVRILRDRIAQADAGGPFAHEEDVLAWLEALSEGKDVASPKATTTL